MEVILTQCSSSNQQQISKIVQKIGTPYVTWEKFFWRVKTKKPQNGKSFTINQNTSTKESYKLQALSMYVQSFHNIKWLPIRAQRHQ